MEFKEVTLVQWKDHCNYARSQWRSLEEIELLTPLELFTSGVVVKETKDYILIVSSWGEDTYGGEMLILKADIVKRTKFKIPTK